MSFAGAATSVKINASALVRASGVKFALEVPLGACIAKLYGPL
jgi:hypothetical protein